MANVEGVSLTEWAKCHPHACLAQRLDLAMQLGKAVQALHHRDVLHQRIHPDNILVDSHGQLVLTDFSACHMRDLDGHRGSRELVRQTGLTEHSAPEYALNSDIGRDRKSTRLNSSHVAISYAVFCLKKKNI